MNTERQIVYVVFGRYAPEPYIAGVFSTREAAKEHMAEFDHPDQYEIDLQWVY